MPGRSSASKRRNPPDRNSGQPWAYQQIQDGDTTCARNQVLHGEAADLNAKIAANSHYDAAVADPLDPVTFVHKINVPVFMACQWEDEQTGGHCPELVRHFTGTTRKWFTFTNGAHIDSLDPQTYNRWYDFLQLFVAHRAPIENAAITRAAAPVIYQAAMGLPQTDVVTLPADPIQLIPTYSAALAAFEQLPRVRVLFDNGAGKSPHLGSSDPGNPYPGFAKDFSSLPIPGTTARTWYFGSTGVLRNSPSTSSGDQLVQRERARPSTHQLREQHRWRAGCGATRPSGNGTGSRIRRAPRSRTSRRHSRRTTRSSEAAPSTSGCDHRPPTSICKPPSAKYVPTGTRPSSRTAGSASERKLSTNSNNMFKRPSTALEPIPTFTAADASPMPAGQFVKVVVPLYYQGHAYRVGSRIRVTIAAPNGSQPVWSFGQTTPNPSGNVSIAFSTSMPSSLVLPIVPGVSVPTPSPPCPSLRNEPCRPYRAIVNNTAVG